MPPRSPSAALDERGCWSPRERLAFASLVLLRVLACVLLLGMVHPDEFFQSQEVMARHVLQQSASASDRTLLSQLFVPWEYELPAPNRSVLFPALVAGVPYQLMHWLGVEPTGFLLLIVPRLVLCIASFSIDYVLYVAATKLKFQDPVRVVLCFASSWPTFVFLTRTFSNTFETLVLAVCVAVLLLGDPHRRVFMGVLHGQTLLLGALLAVGFFTRFTFVFFFFPLGLELARSQDALLADKTAKKTDDSQTTTSSGTMAKRVMVTLFIALQGFLSFAVCSAAFIAMDTLYFRPEMVSDYSQWLNIAALKKIVIAPLNNLVYNLQIDNLELHGVHARITHFAVNMPLLFGPLFVKFLVNVVTGDLRNGNAHLPRHRQLFGVSSVFFPLACLSLAPHQEPRFLLPLLVPLQLFFASRLLRRRAVVLLWVVFNVALTLFFGVLHQGGVVPMLLSFSTVATNGGGRHQVSSRMSNLMPTACHFTQEAVKLVGAIPVVFYKTYMPPRFLLTGANLQANFQVVDLAGGSAEAIATQLQQLQQQLIVTSEALSTEYQVFLVAPATVSVELITKSSFVSVATRVGGCAPHISTEDIALDKPFALELHLLEMAGQV